MQVYCNFIDFPQCSASVEPFYDMLDSLIYGSLSVGGERQTSVLGLWELRA